MCDKWWSLLIRGTHQRMTKTVLKQTQSKQIFQTKLNQPQHTNTNHKKPKPTKPNSIQPNILKYLRCSKVLCNSCTDPYLLFNFVSSPVSLLCRNSRSGHTFRGHGAPDHRAEPSGRSRRGDTGRLYRSEQPGLPRVVIRQHPHLPHC